MVIEAVGEVIVEPEVKVLWVVLWDTASLDEAGKLLHDGIVVCQRARVPRTILAGGERNNGLVEHGTHKYTFLRDGSCIAGQTFKNDVTRLWHDVSTRPWISPCNLVCREVRCWVEKTESGNNRSNVCVMAAVRMNELRRSQFPTAEPSGESDLQAEPYFSNGRSLIQ